MRQSGSHDHPEDEDSGIRIPFTRHEELSPRTPPRQGEGEAGNDHSHEVPEALRVSDGLLFKPRVKLAEHKVDRPGNDDQGKKSGEEMPLFEEDEVADGAHGAESAALGQKACG